MVDVKNDFAKGKILIVDDEPFNVSGITIMVDCVTRNIPGFKLKERVESAKDGIQAVDKVKEAYKRGEEFAVILMDCNMPRMDGYQATQEIRQFLTEMGESQPQIIALTGHSEEKYIQRALFSGMNGFIKKPAQLEDV